MTLSGKIITAVARALQRTVIIVTIMCKGDNDGNSNNTITDREGDNSSRYKNDNNGKNNHFNGNNPPETLMKAVIMTKR